MSRFVIVGLACLAGAMCARAQVIMFVSEYGTGNLRGYDFSGPSGTPVGLPPAYTPVGGVGTGADGMVTDTAGRLYVNRGDGTIYRRSLDGMTFSIFASIGVPDLLDLTRDATHLYAARYGHPTLYRVSLADASWTVLPGPTGLDTSDGVRIGPDGRLYAVDSTDGQIFAYDLSTATWATFLSGPPTPGIASQMEFGADGRVFLSRTVGSDARVYSFTLNTPGVWSSGLNPSSETLIGSLGAGSATGIRIGPDGRLYANNFAAGEVWRSDVGITSMQSSPYVTGVSYPGSIFFAPIPEPGAAALLLMAAGGFALAARRGRLG